MPHQVSTKFTARAPVHGGAPPVAWEVRVNSWGVAVFADGALFDRAAFAEAPTEEQFHQPLPPTGFPVVDEAVKAAVDLFNATV